MKLEIDSFTGYKIYPSKGRLFVRGDSKIFRFGASKNESLFLQRKNPRKIAWTVLYRRMHKKGITEEVAKKRSRKTVKHQRGIVGADIAAHFCQTKSEHTGSDAAATCSDHQGKGREEGERSEKAQGDTSGCSCSQPQECLKAAGKGWTRGPL
ncbi:putative ribosomal protein L24.e.A, cytosolic, partial [Lactarius deliciosus]